MKKLFCMIALGAITFGSVFAAAPATGIKTVQSDTTKTKKKKIKIKTDTSKVKIKKDTTKM